MNQWKLFWCSKSQWFHRAHPDLKGSTEKLSIRQDLSAIEYQIDYVQRMEFFRPSALGIHCPDDNRARLFNETNPKGMKNGLVEFTRSFATIPETRYEFEPGSFTFIEYQDSDGNVTESICRASSFGLNILTFTRRIRSKILFCKPISPLDENGSGFIMFHLVRPRARQIIWLLFLRILYPGRSFLGGKVERKHLADQRSADQG